MTIYRLRESHPTAQKIQKVFDLMEELGLSLRPESNGRGNIFIVKDGGLRMRSSGKGVSVGKSMTLDGRGGMGY